MTNRQSTTGFSTSYRWSTYVAPKCPKGWLKKRFFVFKIQFQSNKVCCKVPLCENFQRQSCSITIPPSNGPQILARNVTLQPKNRMNLISHKIAVLEHASRDLSAMAELLVITVFRQLTNMVLENLPNFRTKAGLCRVLVKAQTPLVRFIVDCCGFAVQWESMAENV